MNYLCNSTYTLYKQCHWIMYQIYLYFSCAIFPILCIGNFNKLFTQFFLLFYRQFQWIIYAILPTLCISNFIKSCVYFNHSFLCAISLNYMRNYTYMLYRQFLRILDISLSCSQNVKNTQGFITSLRIWNQARPWIKHSGHY